MLLGIRICSSHHVYGDTLFGIETAPSFRYEKLKNRQRKIFPLSSIRKAIVHLKTTINFWLNQ